MTTDREIKSMITLLRELLDRAQFGEIRDDQIDAVSQACCAARSWSEENFEIPFDVTREIWDLADEIEISL